MVQRQSQRSSSMLFSYNMVLAEPPTDTPTGAAALGGQPSEAEAARTAVLLEIDAANMVRVTRGKNGTPDEPVHMLQLSLTKDAGAGTFTLWGGSMAALTVANNADFLSRVRFGLRGPKLFAFVRDGFGSVTDKLFAKTTAAGISGKA